MYQAIALKVYIKYQYFARRKILYSNQRFQFETTPSSSRNVDVMYDLTECQKAIYLSKYWSFSVDLSSSKKLKIIIIVFTIVVIICRTV